MNKRGQIRNYIGIIVLLLLFGMSLLFAYKFLSDFNTSFYSSGLSSTLIEETGNNYLGVIQFFDYVFGVIAFLFVVSVGLASFKLASAPVFFILNFAMSALLGFIAYMFSYIFTEYATNSAFTSVVSNFPITLLVGTNLHWLSLFILFVGSITLYSKTGKGQFVQ